jgi:TonB-dependent starch-binding outer membrane protein SusC
MGTLRNSLFLWRKGILSLFLLGFAISMASAQQRTVTGKVTSATEGALPGVNIVVQGTTTGVMSDIEGKFSIVVPGPNASLTFTFIGYTSQTVVVGAQTTLTVELVPATSALGEVVVTGYGTQKKREVTSSIVSVKSDEFNKGNVGTPVALIQGKVSGLSITKNGGDPNGGYNIRLRGLTTIGANSSPLIVIDGVVGGSLDNVDPNDIESMNVLKDGSAAAIYGTRGSSGVIIVTTKKGKKGTAVVDYNVYGTAEMVARTVPIMSAAEWRSLSAEVGKGTDFGSSTDWYKELTRTAYSQVHNISLSGGADKTNYRASLNYRNAEGIMINTGYTQINGRINVTQKALNDKLTIDLNLGATEKQAKYGFSDAFKYATIYNPTAPVKSTDPKYTEFDGYFNQFLYDYYNPIQIAEEDKNDGQDKLMNASLKASYEVVKGLIVDAFYSLQTNSHMNGQYFDKNSYWRGQGRNGLASKSEDFGKSQLLESTAHWQGDLTQNLNISVLGGYSYQDFEYEGNYAEGGNFLTDAFTYNNFAAALDFKNGKGTVTSYKNANKLIAFFGRVNVNISNAFFLTASARYEGSSRFGASNKWGLFPAIGGGADISKYLNVDAINSLKLRVNYGVTGNTPSNSYLSLLRFGPQGNFLYNGAWGPSYSPVSNANTDLKWEKKGEFDAGIDFALLNSKLTGSFDFYTRTTTDLLFTYNVPVPPNLYKEAMLNLGEIKSSGLELTLNWNAISNKDFTYTTSFTPSYNLENTLVSLSGTYNGAELKYGVRDLNGMGAPGQSDVPLVRAEEGKPIGQILTLVFNGVDTNGALTFVDQNGDGSIDPKDRVVVGNGLPKWQFGWGNTFTWKNFDLNVFFRGIFGHDLINSYRGFYEVPDMIGSYNLPVTAKDMRNANGTLMKNSQGILSSYHVEHADFFSLDNMALGYNFSLPKSSAFSKIRLYVAGNNLFYLTGYKGVDPNPRYGDSEDNNNPLVPGVDRRNQWYRTRAVSFGANFVF